MCVMPVNPPFLAVGAERVALAPAGVDHGGGVGGVHDEVHAAVFFVGMQGRLHNRADNKNREISDRAWCLKEDSSVALAAAMSR